MYIIAKEFESKCVGCAACMNVCPVDAITMIEGYHTFLYPKIDENKCINCKRCQITCPVNNYIPLGNFSPTIYAIRADDEIRIKSSSGGAFGVFAEKFIADSGIVYGVTLDENQQVKFIKISSQDDISRCQGSKYVQSEVGFIYREVKKDLEQNNNVLFSGCPCHIAGLKNYLKKDYSNLTTIDILCHGVPSQKLFDEYLKEKRTEKIFDVKFRDKKFGWRADLINISYNKHNYVRGWKDDDAYEIGFQTNLILRDSCENCKFAEFPKNSDITIGDFWGCENFIENDGKGTSVVIINTEKGNNVLNSVSDKLSFLNKLDITINMLKNRVGAFYPHNINKNLFFEHIKTKSFDEAIKMASHGIYDVGIVGIPTVENFGGSLTYVALYYTLRGLNKTCFFVERPKFSKHPPAAIERSYYKTPFESDTLIFDNLDDKESLKSLNEKANCFLVGSDQLFHHNLYNNFSKYVTLDWVKDNKKKIAYAASFGHSIFTGDEDERAEMAYFMQKFDAFSVRESSGVNLAKEVFGIEADLVLDPVFLCDYDIYDRIASNSYIKYSSDDYISAYILDPNKSKSQIISKAEDILQKKSKIYSEMFYNNNSIKNKWDRDIEIGKIEDRLACIQNSSFMVTDSFHGVCFSIIFKKPFIAIKNKGRGVARFESILNLLGLSNRLISEEDELTSNLFEPIDYDEVYKKLNIEVEKSKQWLIDNLTPQNKPYSVYDILNKKINDLQEANTMLLEKLIKYLKLDYCKENNIFEYLNSLISNKNNLIIAIATKDTPGMAITDELIVKLRELGLKSEFKQAHWCGYIALIYKGAVMHENLQYEQALEFNFNDTKNNIIIKSAPLHKGNKASIIINNTDYAINSRGLNFVVFDADKNIVMDSVAFDTHMPRFVASRS